MKELWRNEKSKAGITLALWGVFLLFVFLLVSCSNQKSTVINNPKSHTETISNQFNNFFVNNQSFKMTFISNTLSIKHIYDVTSKNTNTYEGYVEDDLGINKFRCDEKCYKVYLDHEEEEETYYNEFLMAINYLNTSNLSFKQEGNKIYISKDNNNIIKIIVNDDNKINKIIVEKEDEKITFEIV